MFESLEGWKSASGIIQSAEYVDSINRSLHAEATRGASLFNKNERLRELLQAAEKELGRLRDQLSKCADRNWPSEDN